LWSRRPYLFQAKPSGSAPGLYSLRGTSRRIRYSRIVHASVPNLVWGQMQDRLSPQLSFNPHVADATSDVSPATPCLIRTYLHRQLGCRKLCKFICQPIGLRFGRYSPLGKAQSHLQGCAPRRYRNKANLHAKRSAKQLHYGGLSLPHGRQLTCCINEMILVLVRPVGHNFEKEWRLAIEEASYVCRLALLLGC
jgi:hypothetical protein